MKYLLLIVSLMLAMPVNAGWVGYGRITDEGNQRQNGNWRQCCDPSVFFKRNDKSMGYQLEFGGKTKWKWLGYTVAYQDTGSKSLYGRFVLDDAYVRGDFSGIHASLLLQSHSRGFIFTLDPQYTTKNKRFTVYAKIGAKAWRSKTKYCASRTIKVLSSCPHGWQGQFNETGLAFYRALGGQINLKRSALYFEHGISKRDYDTVSFIRNSRPYIAGFRWGF